MAKGSQLTQLKSALSQAGLTRQQSKQKRKRVDHERAKAAAAKAKKLDDIHRKLNPFDVKVTKPKHHLQAVGARKVKGVTGRPAQSKRVGIEHVCVVSPTPIFCFFLTQQRQRKKTLLREYQDRGRAGGVIDRRFGEDDPNMSLEDRMLERFTRERQRTSRGAAFNLDDDEEGEELTHYGQSLSLLEQEDDFEAAGLRLRDEDEEEEEGKGSRFFLKMPILFSLCIQVRLKQRWLKELILRGSMTTTATTKRYVRTHILLNYIHQCFSA
jgi:nucleolar protein 14